MRILLTNDDGIHAPGLAVLETIASELSDDVFVVRKRLRGIITKIPITRDKLNK